MQKNDNKQEIITIKNTDFSFNLNNVLGTIYPNAKKPEKKVIKPLEKNNYLLYNKKVDYLTYKANINFFYTDKKGVEKQNKATVIIDLPLNDILEEEQREVNEEEVNEVIKRFNNLHLQDQVLLNGQIVYNTDTRQTIKDKLSKTGVLIQRSYTKEELQSLNTIYSFIMVSANKQAERETEHEITIKTTLLNYKKFRAYATTTNTKSLILELFKLLSILKSIKIQFQKNGSLEEFGILNGFSITEDKYIYLDINARFFNKLLTKRQISKYEYLNGSFNKKNLATYIMNLKNILKDSIIKNGYLKINLLEIFCYLKGFQNKEITDYTALRSSQEKILKYDPVLVDLGIVEQETTYLSNSLFFDFINYCNTELNAEITPNMTQEEKDKAYQDRRNKIRKIKNDLIQTIDELNNNNDEFNITKCYILHTYDDKGRVINRTNKEDNKFITDTQIKTKLFNKYPNLKHSEIIKFNRFKDFIMDCYIIVKFNQNC